MIAGLVMDGLIDSHSSYMSTQRIKNLIIDINVITISISVYFHTVHSSAFINWYY